MNDQKISALLRRLFLHLGSRRRKQFVGLLALTIVCAIAEVVSLGSVIPFLAVLTAPEQVASYPLVQRIGGVFGVTSADQMILPLTLIFVCAALAAAFLRSLLVWASSRFTQGSGADLGIEVYRRTLYQPYRVHIARNSSEVISGILHKVNGSIGGVLSPLLTLITNGTMVVVITTTLLLIDPLVALTASGGFALCYGIVTWVCRRRVSRNSQIIVREQSRLVKALQEGLGGIRDVLLDGSQPVYCDIYRQSDYPMRRAYASNTLMIETPRYAMEAVGMTIIAAIAYAAYLRPGGVASAIPVLGALALGAQRLLPALQQTYSAWTSIYGHKLVLASALEFLDQPLPEGLTETPPPPLELNESISLDRVSFRYADSGPWILNDLTLTIPKGSRVGIVGKTGSGKSTALDILMGLLAPTHGHLRVDGEAVEGERARAWQRTIAHVPQAIFLSDATFAENIALGLPKRAIDMERVRRAARQAQIADFIEKSAQGYETFVGERGIKLSGGQRQRIAIARALYKRASVLVFDEATSALDTATERSVMQSIDDLDRELTVFLVAHRLTTLQQCDLIVEIEAGRVVSCGGYNELMRNSGHSRQAANSDW